jgi:hypothetical protein
LERRADSGIGRVAVSVKAPHWAGHGVGVQRRQVIKNDPLGNRVLCCGAVHPTPRGKVGPGIT